MPARSTRIRPWRILVVWVLGMICSIVAVFWPGQAHLPTLGLDLQGGTQVILTVKGYNGGTVTPQAITQSVDIIRARVNGLGVAEADVTSHGTGADSAIVVSVPGANPAGLVDTLKQTALLEFRAVLAEGAPEATSVDPKKPASTPPPPGRPPLAFSTVNDPKARTAYAGLDCSNPANHSGGTPADPSKYIVTCASDGAAKYVLSPAFISGTDVTTAAAGLDATAGGWVINLEFNGAGADHLATASKDLATKTAPNNQFAITLDGLVMSAPAFREPINGGRAQISGSFTADSAKQLATVLSYGALPLSLQVASVSTVSATLGADYLRAGVLAGLVGLGLVCLYLLVYYRLLGIVAVSSLAVAGWWTYALLVLGSRYLGLALTLAGVAGAIVAVGITADSFIVYFERIRDYRRGGKTVRYAGENGWFTARNTLLAADFISVLAAVILYVLSVGNVRGFAFTLGLTTVVDVAVAFLLTKPVVVLLSRMPVLQRHPRALGADPLRRRARRRRRGTPSNEVATPPDTAAPAAGSTPPPGTTGAGAARSAGGGTAASARRRTQPLSKRWSKRK